MATLISIALVPFAPLLSLPSKLVAAAAACACLLGGAALGVAKVRAGEPRAAEVATATFAAVGASIAVSTWWLLASGGVGTAHAGYEKKAKKKKKKKEVGSGVGVGDVTDGDGDGDGDDGGSGLHRRPIALAARFASLPWKAAQRASKAGGAICPFTGKREREREKERKRDRERERERLVPPSCPSSLFFS